MQTDIEIKQIRRNVYMSFFQDGLWDMCLGLFVLGWGLGILLDFAHLIGGWFIAIYFLVWGLKKRFTYPRTGYIKLDDKEVRMRARFTIILGVVALLGVFMMVLFSLDARPQWVVDYFPVLFSGMLAVLIGGIAWWLAARRFALHAVIVLAAGAIHQWLGVSWPHTYIVAGAVIALIGAGIFMRFLRQYPAAAPEGPDAAA